jgi:uncharacterized membrane protein
VRVRVVLFVAAATCLLGWVQKLPCHAAGWPYEPGLIFGRRCYSDLPVIYTERGLADGIFPYAPEAGDGLEYPVLTGLVADLTARLTRWLAPDPLAPAALRGYVAVNALLLLGCALLVAWATAATHGRTRDGLLVAAAPTLALAGLINWDLLAVAATALALLAWSRDRPTLAGALIGLGAAAKLYPALLLGPIVVLAVRSRQAAAAVRAVAGAAVAWLVVNLPLLLSYPDGWARFWRFNADRGADFGSVWYALRLLDVPVEPLNPVAAGLFAVACLGVAALALRAPRPPSLPVLAFLTVAAFLVTNKVYSPQYVLWLLPLAALAGMSTVEFAAWQAAEVLYFLAVWHYLTVGETWHYPAATFLRVAVTLWLIGRVAVRAWRPGDGGAQRTWSLRQRVPSGENAAYPSATMSSAT